jgi:hypothetical protein
MAIRVDGGPVPVAYFHFSSGQTFTEGQTVSRGQRLGALRSGSFSGSCGWGSQSATTYHLHFVFLPTSGSYLEIGGGVWNLSSGNFVCGGTTYQPLSKIPNPCGSGVDDDDDEITFTGGGGHIWDGIVAYYVAQAEAMADEMFSSLPEQDPIIDAMLGILQRVTYTVLIWNGIFDAYGLLSRYLAILMLFVLTAEGTLVAVKIVRLVTP